ncbi:hypothetical protein Tco_1261128 [Tanacetum coccineum]
MNPQETQQVAARDEQWVPSAERQFWYTIKKVKDSDSYEFLLANKKCIVNAEVFRIILDICPRVEGVDFTDVPDDDTTLTFLINLGYKGLLNRHTNMFVDHIHQPWRPLAAIINKRLSGKTTSNDKIRKSKIDIHVQNHTRCSSNIPLIRFYLRKAERKTSSKRRVKKKVTLSDDDNIISNDPDAALELAKSISQTKAEKAEATRKVHDTHARIVTEPVSELAKNKSSGRSAKSVVIQDTPSTPKSKPDTSKAKLKGVLSLTLEEQEAAYIIQALKERVLDESIVVFAPLSKGPGTKPGVHDEDKVIIEEKVLLEWGDEDDDDDDVDKDDKDGDTDDKGDDQDADDEDEETDDDDIYKYKILTPIISSVQQTTTPIHTPPTTTDAPTIITTISGSNALTVVELRVAKLEKDVSELKTVDHSYEALAVL